MVVTMKRFLIYMLCLTLICVSCSISVSANISGADIRRGVRICRTAGDYSVSVKLLAYSFEGVKYVKFGKSSIVSEKMAASAQLREIAASALAKSETASEGVVSFYDGSDLEFAVGMAKYKLELVCEDGTTYAYFTVYDRYDFDGLRTDGTFSDGMNNLGYQLQENGVLHGYDWIADVCFAFGE